MFECSKLGIIVRNVDKYEKQSKKIKEQIIGRVKTMRSSWKTTQGMIQSKLTCKIRKNSNNLSKCLENIVQPKQDWYFESKEQG